MKEGVAVVIANGSTDQVILNIIDGQRVGTFCTNDADDTEQVETQANRGRKNETKMCLSKLLCIGEMHLTVYETII